MLDSGNSLRRQQCCPFCLIFSAVLLIASSLRWIRICSRLEHDEESLGMLHDFLIENEKEILELTAKKTLDIAGSRPNSVELKEGLPLFFRQLIDVLKLVKSPFGAPGSDKAGEANAARTSNEPAMAKASGHPAEIAVATTAGLHGSELMRLGYTLSHVVHAYGSMCQAITELAMEKKTDISTSEFHDLNRCLDTAIAGAVTEFQAQQNTEVANQEVEHLGFLAHELRNTLSTVSLSIDLIRRGTVAFSGSTGQVLDKNMKRMAELIDRSLTEVRFRVDPKIHSVSTPLLQLVDQIVITAELEARAKNQTIELQIDPAIIIEVDQQLLHSAVSNLIQNAIKYTRPGGRIQVRGSFNGEKVVIEVEDQCGGLKSEQAATDLFKPFEQQNSDRTGLGLGLTIAERAVRLNHGSIEARNLPGIGCIFKIELPKKPKPDVAYEPAFSGALESKGSQKPTS
jgi:signal transduction histidine kinase